MNNTLDIWNNTLQIISNEITGVSYNTWIKTLEPIAIDDNLFILKTPNSFNKDILETRYADLIKNSLFQATNMHFDLNFITEQDSVDYSNKNKKNREKENYSDFQKFPLLNPKYIFEEFVIGNSNRFAHAASLAVAESPAKAYNPLFIYGDTGLGKTHLIQAIGHKIMNDRPYLKVLYISTEQFINEFIYSIQTNTQQSFKIKYRNVDILLIDDIQFLEKKEETQNEFFHTFNTLYENKKQIVISSDRPPKQIATLTDRLRSRFEGGMITDIQTPNLETREAILRNKAAKENIVISDEAFNYIARRITSSIRALESALANLRMVYEIYNEPISIKHVKEHLKHLFDEETNKKVTPNDIMTKISSIYNVSVEELISKSRQSRIVTPRFISMYIIRQLTDMTTTDIGKQFGDRDHSTVVNAINKIEEDMRINMEFKEQIDELKIELQS